MPPSDAVQGEVVLKQLESGPTFEVWRGPLGTMRLDWTRKGVFRFMVNGHAHGEFAAIVNKRMDAVVRFTGKITNIGDFWNLPTYDAAFRVEQTTWLKQHDAEWLGGHVIFRSKLVAMGISVVNLALGGKLKVHTERKEFVRVMQGLGLPIDPPMPTGDA